MPSHLTLDVIRQPHPDAERDAYRALDDLAEGLADRFIARARRQVAHERRVSEDALDHERERVAEATRGLSALDVSPVLARGDDLRVEDAGRLGGHR